MLGYLQQLLVLASLLQQAPVPSTPSPSAAAQEKANAASVADGPRPNPVVVSTVNPDYTEKARKKHVSGNVEISTLVDTNGVPQR